MRLLFVGESWLGSTARSQRDALSVLPDVDLQDIALESYFPRWRQPAMRGLLRLLGPGIRAELANEVLHQVQGFKPDALVVAKGYGLSRALIEDVSARGCLTVNLFPDVSPQMHGSALRESVGAYGLVISTKPFHPDLWAGQYGYQNKCVCVPHGYDPAVHLWGDAPDADGPIDVLLVATWRPDYLKLMVDVARGLRGQGLTVEVRGHGWEPFAEQTKGLFAIGPAVTGRAYGELMRSAKLVIAPVAGPSQFRGMALPGDQDTTRTYELPAAGCFFLHRRTVFVQQMFDEEQEVPMWADADELVRLILRYLPDAPGRAAMARRAHLRAVPAYSLAARAAEIHALINAELAIRHRV